MPGVFRRAWFPRRRFKGVAPNGFSVALTGLESTAQIGVIAETIISNQNLTGVEATASINGFGFASQQPIDTVSVAALTGVMEASAPDLTHPRTFWIAGIEQQSIAAGTVLLPTSEYVSLTAPNYAIGSSQFYTIGEAHWNGSLQEQGIAWNFVAPFNHIIEIEDAGLITTPITLIYYRWDIGVRSGFTVTSHPVQFTFNGTTIIAERAPTQDKFFSVNYTMTRAGSNPMTLFARYPTIVDDILPDHLLYDGDSGFESYRPIGYRVFDISNNHVFSWNGAIWLDMDVFANNTKFYVKRERAIYNYNAGAVAVVYTAGDSLGAIPETLAYPAFGEGIGKNLLVDGFSPGAAVNHPAAYQVAICPGLYNDWGKV